MFKYTNQFVEFCKNELSFQLQASYGYQSLTACIIDCVYSLRAQYFNTTVPVVERYANMYMNNDRFAACLRGLLLCQVVKRSLSFDSNLKVHRLTIRLIYATIVSNKGKDDAQ